MSKAVWPEACTWEGDEKNKVHRTDDGRVVIRLELRYGAPETWSVLVIVYGPGGRAGERLGWFDMQVAGTFDEAVQRAKAVTFASDLVIAGEASCS